MSKVLIEEQTLYDIGDAIREALSTNTTYKPGEMVDALRHASSVGRIVQTGITNIKDTYGTDGDYMVINEHAMENTAHFVKYIQSTGSGNYYIDSGYIPTSNTRIEYVVLDSANYAVSFGNHNGTTGFLINGGLDSSSHPFRNVWCGAGGFNVNGSWNSDFYTNKPTKHILDASSGSYAVGNVTGVLPAEYYKPSNIPSLSLGLFGRNNSGTPLPATNGIEMYSAHIYESGTIVVEYFPCVDDNGVACLYNTVTGDFVYNSMSGSFIAGPPVEYELWRKEDGHWFPIANDVYLF